MIDQKTVQRELRRSGNVRFSTGLNDLQRARLLSSAYTIVKNLKKDFDQDQTNRRYQLEQALEHWKKADGDPRIKDYVDKFLKAEVNAYREFSNLMNAINSTFRF